ncbi:MAG TPA: hypothetical protein VNO30_04775 [Kofleriaceae bacterium]|nr:hypothetical protein [Kofleriaceae bacterium]
MSACIGEPISWLRLERYALGGAAGDPDAHAHLARCAACARCLGEIRDDLVALPPLAVPAPPPPRARWWAPAMALTAAAAGAILVWRIGAPGPGGPGSSLGARPDEPPREDVAQVARIKGVGEVTLGVVRERAGAIRHDARTFAPGDRWKIAVTCPPVAATWVDVAVYDAGQIHHPLEPARISCGNRVLLPGAFAITGDRPNRVCVRLGAAAAPDREQPPDACVTLRPE